MTHSTARTGPSGRVHATVPPWLAMVQAHADQAQARLDARTTGTDGQP